MEIIFVYFLFNINFKFFRSHLVVIPPGPSLSDALRTSAVLQGEDGYMPAGDFSSGGFDVDANLDPELALVR